MPILELPEGTPKWLVEVMAKAKFTPEFVKWFSAIRPYIDDSENEPAKNSNANLNDNSDASVIQQQHVYSDRAAGDSIVSESRRVTAVDSMPSIIPPNIIADIIAEIMSLIPPSTPLSVISDETYGSNWAKSLIGASRNALRNKFESIPTLDHGTYTPSHTNLTNLDTTQPYLSAYLRIGAMVITFGQFDADPTLTATSTSFEMSLPIASNFVNNNEAGGVAFATGIAGQGAGIFANTGNDTLQVQWVSGDVTNQPMFYIAGYRII